MRIKRFILIALLLSMTAAICVLVRRGIQQSNLVRCASNLSRLRMAIENYISARGHYPPAFVVDAHGNRLYSWRVLILPYLEEHDLYKKFNLDEPWDSPANRPLVQLMPEVFRCPSDVGAEGVTSYVAIAGPGTFWPGSAGFDDHRIYLSGGSVEFPNRPKDDKILLAEVRDSGIVWTEPRDLPLQQAGKGINLPKSEGLTISSAHEGGARVNTFGQTSFLRNTTPREELRSALQIDE